MYLQNVICIEEYNNNCLLLLAIMSASFVIQFTNYEHFIITYTFLIHKGVFKWGWGSKRSTPPPPKKKVKEKRYRMKKKEMKGDVGERGVTR